MTPSWRREGELEGLGIANFGVSVGEVVMEAGRQVEADLAEEGNEISSADLVEPFGSKANPMPSPMTSWGP